MAGASKREEDALRQECRQRMEALVRKDQQAPRFEYLVPIPGLESLLTDPRDYPALYLVSRDQSSALAELPTPQATCRLTGTPTIGPQAPLLISRSAPVPSAPYVLAYHLFADTQHVPDNRPSSSAHALEGQQPLARGPVHGCELCSVLGALLTDGPLYSAHAAFQAR